mgnify:CR=1 FL=1
MVKISLVVLSFFIITGCVRTMSDCRAYNISNDMRCTNSLAIEGQ